MYMANDYKFGFYVRRNSWRRDRYAKVADIQWVEEGKKIKGKPPYFGGFKNPPGHPRAGKIMGSRLVTLEAKWLRGGKYVTDAGGTYAWERVYPDENGRL